MNYILRCFRIIFFYIIFHVASVNAVYRNESDYILRVAGAAVWFSDIKSAKDGFLTEDYKKADYIYSGDIVCGSYLVPGVLCTLGLTYYPSIGLYESDKIIIPDEVKTGLAQYKTPEQKFVFSNAYSILLGASYYLYAENFYGFFGGKIGYMYGTLGIAEEYFDEIAVLAKKHNIQYDRDLIEEKKLVERIKFHPITYGGEIGVGMKWNHKISFELRYSLDMVGLANILDRPVSNTINPTILSDKFTETCLLQKLSLGIMVKL